MVSEIFEVTITGTHGVKLPESAAAPFYKAGHKRVKMTAWFKDKHIEFHGALHLNKGNFVISFGKRYQKELGVGFNDYFDLQLAEDTSKYGVEMPEELSAVLESDPMAADVFEDFTDGKKRSLIYYVLRFKNSQTRIDKSLIIAENMKHGISDPKELIRDRR
ncbi:MAG: YdeI/OmpD-associated family protein [Bacteroidia bacterium]|nr:YdeI/OmpD-associated family protein [Bacteroidia bacterium]MBT8275389.1 YdeI/OmpD-associated family protein [Bacteroidia bacterium]NNJ81294.1 YdeI/OmpD-associated family protein [Flavobacteriaceae bacterium]NNM08010.1 YdeI/OmpD-associated family protein [Flavobacteriaceae bacterium]